MKITIWGTRGSIPTPTTSSFETSRYGGDTTCVSVESDELLVIFDGGSGLRLLGLELAARKQPLDASFFFSHVHWDHIQGFPFFLPAFRQGNRFHLYGPRLAFSPGFVGNVLEKALRGQQEDLNFPVQLKDMPAEMIFHDIDNHQPVNIQGQSSLLRVIGAPTNHPGGCFGYRVEEHREGQPVKVFSICSDTEHGDDLNPNVQFLAQDSDLMIYDSQYTPAEYAGEDNGISRRGWGHSTWQWAIKEATAARAKHLLLHHHDPLHDDNAVAAIEAAAKKNAAPGLIVEAASQGSHFRI